MTGLWREATSAAEHGAREHVDELARRRRDRFLGRQHGERLGERLRADACSGAGPQQHGGAALQQPQPQPLPKRHALARIKVLLPKRLAMRSTASKAVLLRTSKAGLSSITSSEPRRPLSAIISMHNCASR